jgi:phage-related protein (TIGR01555 family)
MDSLSASLAPQKAPVIASPAVVKPSQPMTDGWANLLTGLGRAGRDKRTANQATYGLALPESVAEDLYAADSTARRIVELLPSEALREWLTFDDEKLGKPVQAELDRLQVQDRLLHSWVDARLYGGAGLFINDGTPVEQLARPLRAENLDRIISLTKLNRWELWTWATDIHRDISHPSFGLPSHYHLFPRMAFGQVSIRVHASRIIRFDGKRLPRLLFIRNNFWGDSVLTALFERLGDYKMSGAAIAAILTDVRLLVLKMKGLTQAVAAGQEVNVQRKLELMNAAKSIIGALAIDADDDVDYHSSTLQGVADLVDKVGRFLQAETDIPHTILFNESPSGLGATGRSEERQWYDHVAAQQRNYLKPRFDQIMKLIFAQKRGPFGGAEPENWKYTFNPLWQMNDKERAEVEKLEAETDDLRINSGIRTPETIQKARFPQEALEGAPEVLDLNLNSLDPEDDQKPANTVKGAKAAKPATAKPE